jgi:DNA-binding beta-propeller fold protein YncE
MIQMLYEKIHLSIYLCREPEAQNRPKALKMAIKRLSYIALPPHQAPGGFDHAAVHSRLGLLYVAHTANDALDVINCVNDHYLRSILHLNGVAGALVSEDHDLVFTSNRGENTVGVFSPANELDLVKVNVGTRPNGLAHDPSRNLLLAANVGDPKIPSSFTISIVDVHKKTMISDIAAPGRTRWAVYDPSSEVFFVNIADPAQIAIIRAAEPTRIAGVFDIPATGAHGLDIDLEAERLYCACDGKALVSMDSRSGKVLDALDIGGVPDVIFFNAALKHLYVAIGDPGIIQITDTDAMKVLDTIPTELGAHTIAFDPATNKVYGFLPQTSRAVVYLDEE